MKKILSLLLVCVLCVGMLVSCGGPEMKFGKDLLSVESQLDALNGLKKGDADIAVIDSIMAGYYMNNTDEFKDYQILEGVVLAAEEYGIAAKKGNKALMSKINEAIIALANTDYKTIADTYGLASELLVTADTVNPLASAEDDSWNGIVTDKKLIIGYTIFAPIAFNDGDGEDAVFKGFDIDLAKAVVAYLNATYSTEIEVEFVKIEWAQKETLLENGSIDLVWNGMTITDERIAAMEISVPYLANKQVAVIAKADAEKYACTDYDSFVVAVADAIITAEKGSAGEELAAVIE
ncbi:MAG: transporter substrate-binding domain-containing protein [Clostridia bacterium]|nr:transporter substrate-binding domain-containing protein [Clostridia bacterium]